MPSHSTPAVPRPTLTPWLVLLAPLLAVVLYLNVVDNPFHSFDALLTTANGQVNPAVSSTGFPAGAWGQATPDTALHSAHYRPVLVQMLRAEYRVWGDSPSSFHSVNLMLFIAAVVLMLLVTAELIPHRGGRAIAVFLFAAHPMASESVQGIGGQGVLLAVVALLGAARWLLRFRQGRHGAVSTAVVLGVFTLIGSGAHEMGLLIPLLLLALAYAPVALPPTPWRGGNTRDMAKRGKKSSRAKAEEAATPPRNLWLAIPAAVLLAAGLMLYLRSQGLGALFPAAAYAEARGLNETLPPELGGAVLVRYLARLFFPWHPTLLYAPQYEPNLLAAGMAGWGGLVALGAAAIYFFRRNALGVALVWLLLPLVALLHLIPLTQALGEGALCFALPGACLAIGAAAALAMSPNWAPGRTRPRDAATLGLACAACLALCVQTWARGTQWKSVEALWNAESAMHPANPRPQAELIANYRRTNQLDKAAELLPSAKQKAHGADYDLLVENEALLLVKKYETAKLGDLLDDEIITSRTVGRGHFEQLASLAEQNQMRERAVALWRREFKIDPQNINALGSLADVAVRQKDFKTALKYAQDASHLAPPEMRAGTLAHLGQIMAQSGDTKLALAQFAIALQRDNTMYMPYQYMIRILAREHDLARALITVNAAFKYARVTSYAELAMFYVAIVQEMGNTRDAIDKLMQIVGNHPNDIELRIFTAKFLLRQREYNRAEQIIYSLREVSGPRQAELLTALAYIKLARDKNTDMAKDLLGQALQADPNFTDAQRMLEQLRNPRPESAPEPPSIAPPAEEGMNPEAGLSMQPGSPGMAPAGATPAPGAPAPAPTPASGVEGLLNPGASQTQTAPLPAGGIQE